MANTFDLAYGNSSLKLVLPDYVDPLVLRPREIPGLAHPTEAVAEALASPSGTPPLLEMLRARKPKRVTIVVNDETRPTPYEVLFPPLLEVFAQAGITDEQVTFVIATGIHPAHSDELNARIYGSHMTKRFRFVNHVSTDTSQLVDLGTTSSGYPCFINRLALETDFLLTIGVVMPHYFAGFSGGRKSILPGLAGHKTVASNHARMVELLDALPPVRENPVSLEMIEVARKVGVDFILNTVTNPRKELVKVVAGDLEKAWYEAVDVSASIYEVPFDEPVDIAITTACGYPRDVNVYQAQKALDHADHITKPGGSIIWLAECPAGFGEDVFEKWLRLRLSPQEVMRRIRSEFELGGHKAYAIAKVAVEKDVALISEMSASDTSLLFAHKAASLDEAVSAALAKHGPSARVAVLPDGCLTLPVPRS